MREREIYHNLLHLATQSLHQKGQTSSLKWGRNADKFSLLCKQINITPYTDY